MLYQKHRPPSLKGVKGNKEVVSSLRGMLENVETMSHALMFYGPTGCGKTTLARIVSNALKVEDVDYKEIDSADFRGIDTVRELRRNIMYKPLKSPFRVYVLDEMHQLTKDAQSALLKILEDTPSHVFFILCTTDPQKVLPTVRNRCIQMQVELLTDEEMTSLIKKVVKKEKTKLEDNVIEVICESADGCARQGLTILEKVLATPPKEQLKTAKQSKADEAASIELCRVLLKKNVQWKEVATIVKGLKGQPIEGIRRHVLGYAASVALNRESARVGIILEEFIDPFFDTGYPQLVLACLRTVNS